MKMTEEEARCKEAFEAHRNRWCRYPMLEQDAYGVFRSSATTSAWQDWQAAMSAALAVIERRK